MNLYVKPDSPWEIATFFFQQIHVFSTAEARYAKEPSLLGPGGCPQQCSTIDSSDRSTGDFSGSEKKTAAQSGISWEKIWINDLIQGGAPVRNR